MKTNFKTVFMAIVLLLSSVSSFGSSPRANLANIAKRYGKALTSSHVSKRVTRNIKAPLNHTVGQVQTILLIMIITGVDLVKSHYEQSQMLNQDIDKAELNKHIAQAADLIVNSGEIYSAILGSLLTVPANHVLLNAFADRSSRGFFKKFLITAMSTFITFIGWELGAELYHQATQMMIENEDHLKLTDKFAPITLKVLTGRASSIEQDVFDEVLSNVYQILFTNEELRKRWIFCAWRHRIATGHFVTLVGSMASASAIGTSMIPSAGTFWGLVFGLAGGVGSLYIPHHQKNKITDFIRNRRQDFWQIGIDTQDSFYSVRKDIIKIALRVVKNNETMPSLLKLNHQSFARDMYINPHIEKVYTLLEERFLKKNSYKQALESKTAKPEVLHELAEEVEKLKERELEELIKITSFYKKQHTYLDNVLKKQGFDKHATPGNMRKYPILKDILLEYIRMQRLYHSFADMIELAKDSSAEDIYLAIITNLYFFAFSENLFLDLAFEIPLEDSL